MVRSWIVTATAACVAVPGVHLATKKPRQLVAGEAVPQRDP
jgi:hypothetical protein